MMVQDPSNPNIQYVVQKGGIIRTIIGGAVQATNLVNLSSQVSTTSERGLLGLAFPDDWGTSGLAYVYYTDTGGTIRIGRLSRTGTNPPTLDTTIFPIISQAHPTFANHNGGCLRFGPDGMLYAGLGDGGSGNDPNQNAQNPNTLLGKMIRIDVGGDDFPLDTSRNYRIPSDNPFVDGVPIAAMGEIWHFGVRNPWKWSFDLPAMGGTGAMLIADVGQNAWEEVNYQPAGIGGYNWGWRVREGAHVTMNGANPLGGSIAYKPLTDPIHEYIHPGGAGRSITGGYVYRGAGLGNYWRGRYFFGDYVNGQFWTFRLDQVGGVGSASDVIDHIPELGSMGNVGSIDIDSAGEIYVVSFGGTIYKLVSSAVAPTAISFFRGSVLSGGLPEILDAEDQRLNARPGSVLSSSESPLQIELTATAPPQTVSALRFFIESQANTPNLTQVVELWDYTTGAYVPIDSRGLTFNADSRLQLTATTPARFIQGGTRQMRARIRVFASGTLLTFPWIYRLDQAVWGFTGS